MRDLSALFDTVMTGDQINPKLLAKALGIPAKRMARVCRVHENTVNRLSNSKKLQAALQEVVSVLSALNSIVGGPDFTVFWFRFSPIPDMGHRCPIQIVEAGEGPELLEYLKSRKPK